MGEREVGARPRGRPLSNTPSRWPARRLHFWAHRTPMGFDDCLSALSKFCDCPICPALSSELGTSAILITHDLGVVAGLTDRIVVMYAGRIVERATTRELFANPSHPYTIGLLRSVPRLDQGGTGRLIPIPGLPPNVATPFSGCPFADRCPFTEPTCNTDFPAITSSSEAQRLRPRGS